MSNEDDGGYSDLAPSVRRKIDEAFDSAVLSSTPYSVFQPRTASNHLPPGGFLPDDPSPGRFVRDSPPPGGFLPETPQHLGTDRGEVPTDIPLSLIPVALQLLNLQPDDDDVLSVFHNAASGWNRHSTSEYPQDGLVSRRDWRAVCAALLDPGLARDDPDMDDASSPSDALTADVDEASDSGQDYRESDSNMDDDQNSDDDSDYHEGGFIQSKRPAGEATSKTVSKTSRGRGRKASTISSENGSEAETGLSGQQKKECRAAFALFFPDAPDETLDKARIRIKDVTRAAALIKEKLSAEEIVDMLEAFSSSPDKSVGLEDFERMMVATKMV
ncbi:hypothetical protein GSI_12976 [Ganoderma sinense ZZ0214-1]|uniref:EF-hand domain-containing protein n=1 Tax=Ganoderma sinense ZZ0214-1 TaxID=1077348 RepID=A0A2G8RU95_9APHY|nr:hypothetical protein GSI_12976 [Ganoderma sinense ZZ0214-1]